jgi:hypothetical protein
LIKAAYDALLENGALIAVENITTKGVKTLSVC